MMRPIYLYSTILVSILIVFSCETIVDEPVETCTFSETIDNDTHPYNDLYQEILDVYVAKGIPGISIAIESPEHGWWVGCAGMARIEDEIEMKTCHLFYSASMVKPYTATMIMRLLEDGQITLDDPIRNYLPAEMVKQIANADEATIRQLLNHTSGIDGIYPLKMIWDTFNDPLLYSSIESLLEKYVYGDPAVGPVGEKYSYCNTGYALLGMIIEEASKMSLGDYFEQEIIEPLGLVNTYFKNTPEYPDDVQYKTNSYMELAPGQIQNCTDFTNNIASIAMGGDGLFATPYEFARFYQELLRGNVLDSSTMRLMLHDEIRIPEEEESYQCLGLEHDKSNVFGDIYWHGGGWFGTLSHTKYFPGSDVTISINTNGTGVTFRTEETFERTLSLFDEIENVTFTGKRN